MSRGTRVAVVAISALLTVAQLALAGGAAACCGSPTPFLHDYVQQKWFPASASHDQSFNYIGHVPRIAVIALDPVQDVPTATDFSAFADTAQT